MDAVQQANAGHPGTAMALAPLAYLLYTEVLRHNPASPHWPNRDRFVLSAGHACVLQYSALHLSGYNLSLEELKRFRQWQSATPGHPEFRHTEGVEVTTGPLGQGFANGVGMGFAERFLADDVQPPAPRDRRPPRLRDLLGRRPDGGRLLRGRLARRHERRSAKLIYFYDDNHITIDGTTCDLLHGGPGEALRGARLARAVGRRPERPGNAPRRRSANAQDETRAAVGDHRALAHRLRRAARGRHGQVARLAARRGRGRCDEEGARLGSRTSTSTFPTRSTRT